MAVDPVSLSLALTATVVAVLSLIRYSKCGSCFEVRTRTPTTAIPPAPLNPINPLRNVKM